MQKAGKAAADGLKKGMKDQKKEVREAAAELAQNLVDAIKDKLKIKSPSQVFAELAHQSAAGLAQGFDESHGLVSDAATRMISATLVTPDLGQLQALAETQSRAALQVTLAGSGTSTGSGRTNVYKIDATNMTPAELRRELEDADRLDAALYAGSL